MVGVVAIRPFAHDVSKTVLAGKNIMRTEATSVKSSMKIAQTPVLIASHGSTCLSVLERCRGDRDWVVEAADRIFADAFEIEIAFDEGVECAGQ